jgi:prepilin signal peptidase PulO-like enzyme (type II secretory pathway)
MIILILLVFGVCFGSFINALIWRIHLQSKTSSKKKQAELSIVNGRSMCMYCNHQLSFWDLIPVASWIALKGRCRYCRRKYPDTPVSELLTPLLFLFSYVFWPMSFDAKGTTLFIFWLIFLTGFIALALYDLRWYLLPNRIIFPLYAIVAIQIVASLVFFDLGLDGLLLVFASILVGGGIFYLLFQISHGKWIGGGDVKLGFLIGALLGDPLKCVLFIFLASLIGTLISLPMLVTGKMKRTSHLPFGPFLLISAFIVVLFGDSLIQAYRSFIGL